jgi:hypothetical protein
MQQAATCQEQHPPLLAHSCCGALYSQGTVPAQVPSLQRLQWSNQGTLVAPPTNLRQLLVVLLTLML